jgi:hypothetical protein
VRSGARSFAGPLQGFSRIVTQPNHAGEVNRLIYLFAG